MMAAPDPAASSTRRTTVSRLAGLSSAAGPIWPAATTSRLDNGLLHGRARVAPGVGLEAHGVPVRPSYLVGLARQERKFSTQGEPGRPLSPLVRSGARIAAHEVLATDDGKAHTGVRLRISDERLGLAAARHEASLLQELPSQ